MAVVVLSAGCSSTTTAQPANQRPSTTTSPAVATPSTLTPVDKARQAVIAQAEATVTSDQVALNQALAQQQTNAAERASDITNCTQATSKAASSIGNAALNAQATALCEKVVQDASGEAAVDTAVSQAQANLDQAQVQLTIAKQSG